MDQLYLDISRIRDDDPYWWFRLIVGARGCGKTYGVQSDVIARKFIKAFRKASGKPYKTLLTSLESGEGKVTNVAYTSFWVPFVWLRTTDYAIGHLLSNNAQKFFHLDILNEIRKKTGIDWVIRSRGNNVSLVELDDDGNKKREILFALCFDIMGFHNLKGSSGFFQLVKLIVADEITQERTEKKIGNGGLAYAFVHQIESICRLRKGIIVYMLSNYLQDCFEILELFKFKPMTYGYYKIGWKHAIIWYYQSSKLYEKAHQDSLAGVLMKGTSLDRSTFDNAVCRQEFAPIYRVRKMASLKLADAYIMASGRIYVTAQGNRKSIIIRFNEADPAHAKLIQDRKLYKLKPVKGAFKGIYLPAIAQAFKRMVEKQGYWFLDEATFYDFRRDFEESA